MKVPALNCTLCPRLFNFRKKNNEEWPDWHNAPVNSFGSLNSRLLILGLGTRLGAIAILATMSVAIYHAIVTSGFNIYLLELLALYFASAFSIFLLGPGMFSADYLISEILLGKSNFINSIFWQNKFFINFLIFFVIN